MCIRDSTCIDQNHNDQNNPCFLYPVMTIISSVRQMVETPIHAINEGTSPAVSYTHLFRCSSATEGIRLLHPDSHSPCLLLLPSHHKEKLLYLSLIHISILCADVKSMTAVRQVL